MSENEEVKKKRAVSYRDYYENEVKRLNWLNNTIKKAQEKGTHIRTKINEQDDECLFSLFYNDGYSQVRLYFDIYVDENLEIVDWFRDDDRWANYYNALTPIDKDEFFTKAFEWLEKAFEKLKEYVVRPMMPIAINSKVRGKIEEILNEIKYDDIYGYNLARKKRNSLCDKRLTCGAKRRDYYIHIVRKEEWRKERGLIITIYLSDETTIADIITKDYNPADIDITDDKEFDEEVISLDDLMSYEIIDINEDMSKEEKDDAKKRQEKQKDDTLESVMANYSSFYMVKTPNFNVIEKNRRKR